MAQEIRKQNWPHYLFYALFGLASIVLLWWYLSDTLIHFTTSQQFPVNSFKRFPLTMLIFPAELFSVLFGLYFVYNLFSDKRSPPPKPLANKEGTRVAILLPVYNEPKDIVERTIKACKKIRWVGGKHIYLLDDSTEETSVQEMKELGEKHGCTVVRRPDREGYKAGNINHGIKNAVTENYFMILDADQAPEPDFLEETMDYFSDKEVCYVQTPQFFVNDKTPLERGAKLGANIFFQGMCVGRAKDKAMVFCGTNAVISKEVFEEVNGFSYYTATEDIELGLRMNDAGYYGVYVPKILVKGYAPTDFKAYKSQQYRWANGNLAILRESFAKLFKADFSLRQQIHYLFTLGWWLIGIVTLAYITVPVLSLAFRAGTHHTWLPTFVLVILYFNVALGIGMIYVSLKNRVQGERVKLSDAFLQYSLITNSMFIYARAAINALVLKKYVGFITTNKKKSETGLGLVKWNLILGAITFAASLYAMYNAGIASDVLQIRTFLPLSLWLLFYSLILASSILFVGENKNAEVIPA